jgi:polar amino acid transport system substrate-binding protein
MRYVRNAVFLFLLVGYSGLAYAQTAISMTSLDWPPYVGKDVSGQGIATVVVRNVFSEMGLSLKVDFFPWDRARENARSAPYSGYYPAYQEEILSGFIASDPVFSSPLVVAERIASPLTITSEQSLIGKKIGVVQGYGNTVAFDDLVAKGKIKTDKAPEDNVNILKLASGRVDGIMIDLYTMAYILQTDKNLIPIAKEVRANSVVIANKSLYVAFPDTPEGHKYRDAFNLALKKVPVKKIVEDYLIKYKLK